MGMDWQLDGLIGNHAYKINSRCQTSLVLATNGNTLEYLTYNFSLRHPRGIWQKPWLVTKKLSTLKSKGQVGATICSAYDKHSESQTCTTK